MDGVGSVLEAAAGTETPVAKACTAWMGQVPAERGHKSLSWLSSFQQMLSRHEQTHLPPRDAGVCHSQ